jgi:hypothetical protein
VARIRTIKPDFFRSDDVAQLTYRARLTWVGLWTYVDDEGRGKDNARIIKGDLWPLEDDVTHIEVEQDLAELAKAGRIRRYEVGGEKYLLILKWTDHQRIAKPTASKLPPPDDSDTTTEPSQIIPGGLPEDYRNATEPLPVGREEEVEQGRGSGEGKGRRATRIPPDFTITPEMRQYAAEKTPDVNINIATAKFINHWTAASGAKATKLDWLATWRNWMLSDQERASRNATPHMDHSARSIAKGMALLQAYDAKHNEPELFELEA